jgi:hypothetical protein
MKAKLWSTLLFALLYVGLLFGQTNELKDNQAVLTQYMHTFQMDGWHIELVLADRAFIKSMMHGENTVGASELNFNTKYGVIWVMKRSEYTPEAFKSFQIPVQDEEWIIVDQRNTVVHELIHMVWRYCGNTEQCVSMLAEAVIPHEDTH